MTRQNNLTPPYQGGQKRKYKENKEKKTMKILEYCNCHPPIAYIHIGLWYAAIHGVTENYVYLSEQIARLPRYMKCTLFTDDKGKYFVVDSVRFYLDNAISPALYAWRRLHDNAVVA